MKDVGEKLGVAVKTGDVRIGVKEAINSLLTGNPKLVVLSDKIPANTRNRLIYYCILSETPYEILDVNSTELGVLTGKPYPISTLAVIEPGDSKILG